MDAHPVLWLYPLNPLLVCQGSLSRVAWPADDHDVAEAMFASMAERYHVVCLLLRILERAIAIRTA